jgi:hypothetical protein
MSNNFYFQGPEEEMEFMPIIPLNEEDNDDAETAQIP